MQWVMGSCMRRICVSNSWEAGGCMCMVDWGACACIHKGGRRAACGHHPLMTLSDGHDTQQWLWQWWLVTAEWLVVVVVVVVVGLGGSWLTASTRSQPYGSMHSHTAPCTAMHLIVSVGKDECAGLCGMHGHAWALACCNPDLHGPGESLTPHPFSPPHPLCRRAWCGWL